MSCSDRDVNIVGANGWNFPINNTDFEASAPFSFEVPIGSRVLLRLLGINGQVTITGASGASSVMITGVKRVRSESLQDAEDHLGELHVSVDSLANEVFVETIQPHNSGGRNYIVDYTITLPTHVAVQVMHVNGIVTLNSIEHDVTVHHENGEVTLRGIVGNARVNLVNGPIEGDITLPVHGTIDLNTVNGHIDLALPANTSAIFSARVSSGRVSLSDLVLQDDVSTSTSLSGTLGNGQGTISLETRNGNIRVSGF
jgi:hypothetical protein